MSQEETPLFTGLINHIRRNPVPFHIPGHKKGRGMDPQFREFVGDAVLAMDLINISPLDDLHHPTSIIKQAQDLAAEAFGADHTFFSVQGTSGAIMTMILATCRPGDKIIVPRNAHKSVMSAIILADAIPVFIHPVLDERIGIAHGITTSALAKALKEHPDAKAVLVINPTYYGVAADIKQIVDLAHAHHLPVLVDEAHGVHIHFHERLPMSAMQAGADMAATSMHKLGGSLTQSSILNIQGPRVNPHRVQAIMNMLTTTSTSYILLASLDAARRFLATQGHERLTYALELATYARQQISEIPGLYCIGPEILGGEATHALDLTKLPICVKDLGITGYEAEIWLREHYNIEVELSDLYNILCIITPGDTYETVNLLIKALQHLSRDFRHQLSACPIHVHLPPIPVLALSPREAFYADTELVPLREAVGRIIAEFIMVYPPGIPILLPGEIIEQESLDYIQKNMEAGLPVQGPEDPTLEKVKVIKEYRPIA
ncbi:MAG: arginine decarboxylase [Bacillus thermozeamaize]|uniref:Arginine decarboxylase n=1 Tax=Bacillus thermozeamaize TaxID=230954 RepID=A0A1Y3PAG4_9BACI|nr:MAG: arginine decarboxylase [Bacillus thermozeamaize]